MRLFFMLVISLFSSSVYCYEIPDIVKKDPKTISWNWTTFSADFGQKVTISADYTKSEKTNDNFIFIPTVTHQYQTNKTSDNIEWLRVHCDNNTQDSLGAYEKSFFSQTFSFKLNQMQLAENTNAAVAKQAVCGFKLDGKSFFGIMALVQTLNEFEKNPRIFFYAWSPEDITKENIHGSIVTFKIHIYQPSTKQMFSSSEANYDCEKKLMKNSQFTTTFDTAHGRQFLYHFNHVCSIKDKLASQIVESTPELKETKLSLENAKEKCTSFGLKPKTEKFGICVLELMK
ncbi:protein of unknown function [Candidatus Methylopumilus planktonicus]|uniref:Lipoprotein n=1 Tax=Candidatus Methylopumilus planktonicus TaxID=1581557 RepID=A0A0D6EVT5_9PROT|nr:hypothetical protein [Candidatus Methylopumilus planktonicus]CEZ19752.1 protein of unknown function [Candidatus Methylopumilus planktonicus]